MFGWFRKKNNKVEVKEQTKANRANKEAKDVDLIRFFRNEQTDCEGRMLEDILKYTPDEIEHKHNFIQWIFPTISKSRFNRNAPIIDDSFKERFQNDNLVKCNFCNSCLHYLNYIGFQCKDGNITCVPSHRMFYQLPSHNLLRITRVLDSLNQIGNSECSRKLYKSIMDEVELHPDKIPLETKLYWEATQPLFATKREVPNMLLGAIAGDIIGSIYEFYPVKSIVFDLFTFQSKFTDDSVMTVANADWLLTGDGLLGVMQEYGNRYLRVGYGGMFLEWLRAYDPQPYNSFGNGSAMRVSPVGWAFNSLEETLKAAKKSAEITHNHPEGIKGAQATAACIYLARTGKSKQEIKEYVEHTFGYNLNRTCDEIRPTYGFDETCQGTVPESIIAFLESTDYESAIRLAVSLGGDADTMGAITGGIAEAYYKEIPQYIKEEVAKRLPAEFIEIMKKFYDKYVMSYMKKEIKCGVTPNYIEDLKENEIFVFGSNLQGAHGGGAAYAAFRKFGAIWGQGVGLQGQSYAIPTMQGGVDTIKPYTDEFITFAKEHTELHFLITKIGCGIAGFREKDIAPLFTDAIGLSNVSLPQEFIDFIIKEN